MIKVEDILKAIDNGEFNIDEYDISIGGCGCCSDSINHKDLTIEQKDIIAKAVIKRMTPWLINK